VPRIAEVEGGLIECKPPSNCLEEGDP
jgi:hypothetical protein